MILAVTPGDPEGIGPEITWKILRKNFSRKSGAQLLCVGAIAPFKKLGAPIIEATLIDGMLSKPPKRRGPFVWILPAPTRAPTGKLLPGFQSGWSIQKAVELIHGEHVHALVTGPISKSRLQKGGFPFEGHTELLAHLCKRKPKAVTMMLANDLLRVSLVTIHIGLKDVSKAVTEKEIRRAVLQTEESLKKWWGIRKPRIAVTGLNPHSGEMGIFGSEEIEVIEPAIRRLRTEGIAVSGPHPADTFFAKQLAAPKGERCDAVVCMYHDQGLIPVKLLDFRRTVNVTLGLPLVRTSVDHGVGFDIAGKNRADPSSLEAAIQLATEIVRKKETL
jgi:4-hydroxythreonine-4-phosphate dehydrogenase